MEVLVMEQTNAFKNAVLGRLCEWVSTTLWKISGVLSGSVPHRKIKTQCSVTERIRVSSQRHDIAHLVFFFIHIFKAIKFSFVTDLLFYPVTQIGAIIHSLNAPEEVVNNPKPHG